MRQLTFLVSVIFFGFHAHAQKMVLSGSIIDSSGLTPVSFATIYLFRADSTGLSKPIQSAFSGEDGQFMWKNIDTGSYVLKINMLGYSPAVIPVIVVPGTNNLGRIGLLPLSGTLKEVTITVHKPLLEMKPDRIIYNVEDDPANAGATTSEILRKIPFISVDMDDNIRLKGKTNFKVQLNGRSTGLFARSPKEAIRSFPANLIVRIEVIVSPGARYDAEGVGGIINIVTRKKVVGTRGSVAAGINTIGEHNESFNISSKQGKIGLSLLLGTTGKNNVQYTKYERINSYPSSIHQETRDGEGVDQNLTFNGFTEIAWDIDSLNTISVHTLLNRNSYNSTMNSDHLGIDADNNIVERGQYQNTSVFDEYTRNTGIDYIRKFRKMGRELDISVVTDQKKANSTLDVFRNFEFGPPDSRRLIIDAQPEKENTVDMNYAQSINDRNSMSCGLKTIFRDFKNNYTSDSLHQLSNQLVRDYPQSGIFDYSQNIWSAYAEHSLTLTKWGFQTGLRYEYTQSNGALGGEQPFVKNYPSFFPSFNVSYLHDPKNSFRLGLTKRIQRPGLWYLNPQADWSDPRKISYGNSFLGPEYTYNIDLGWNMFAGRKNYSISAGQSWTTGVINQVTFINASNGIINSTYLNTGQTTRTALNASISGAFTKKLFLLMNAEIAYERLSGNSGESVINNQGFTGQCFGSVGYNVAKGWMMQGVGYYNLGYLMLQSRAAPTYNYQVAVSKTLLKTRKLRLTLTANMPGQKNWAYKNTTNTPELYITNIMTRPARYFQLGCNWRFGKLREDVTRKRDVSNSDIKAAK